MYKVLEIKPLKSYRLWLKFVDGTEGIVNLSHLKGKGVFRIWDGEIPFEQVYVDSESGAIAWSEQVDICADNLYFKLNDINPEQIFPNPIVNASNQ